MRVFIKMLPFIVLVIIPFCTEGFFRNDLLKIVIIPKDIKLISIIAIASYTIGLVVGRISLLKSKQIF